MYAQAAVRVDPAIGEAGDVDTAVVVLRHENGCITTIDNSRQAVYGYDQRVEAFGSGGMAARARTRSHTPASRRSAAGTTSTTIPYFFLERYIPSYLARVGGVRRLRARRRPLTGRRRRWPCPTDHRSRRQAVRGRRPRRAHQRDHLTLRPQPSALDSGRARICAASALVASGRPTSAHSAAACSTSARLVGVSGPA